MRKAVITIHVATVGGTSHLRRQAANDTLTCGGCCFRFHILSVGPRCAAQAKQRCSFGPPAAPADQWHHEKQKTSETVPHHLAIQKIERDSSLDGFVVGVDLQAEERKWRVASQNFSCTDRHKRGCGARASAPFASQAADRAHCGSARCVKRRASSQTSTSAKPFRLCKASTMQPPANPPAVKRGRAR